MTYYEQMVNMVIEDMAKTRIRKYTDGGYTYFCGDFEGEYTNIFQSTVAAYQQALAAEIKWLNSEEV